MAGSDPDPNKPQGPNFHENSGCCRNSLITGKYLQNRKFQKVSVAGARGAFFYRSVKASLAPSIAKMPAKDR